MCAHIPHRDIHTYTQTHTKEQSSSWRISQISRPVGRSLRTPISPKDLLSELHLRAQTALLPGGVCQGCPAVIGSKFRCPEQTEGHARLELLSAPLFESQGSEECFCSLSGPTCSHPLRGEAVAEEREMRGNSPIPHCIQSSCRQKRGNE